MQSFYPPHLKQRLALGLLLLLVILLHLAGLHSFSSLWPTALSLDQPVHLKLKAGNTSEVITTQASALPTSTIQRRAVAPLVTASTEAAPVSGLHAVQMTDEDLPENLAQQPEAQETPLAETTAPREEPPVLAEPAAAEPVAPVQSTAPLLPATHPVTASNEPVNAAPETLPAKPQPADMVTAEAVDPAAPPSAIDANANKPDPVAAEKPNQANLAAVAAPADDAPPWLSQAKFIWPASTKFIYEVIGESKGIRFNADGDMQWKHDGSNYEMRLEIRHFLLGSKTQTSVGQLSSQGLQPKRFGDKYKQEIAAHFDRDKNVLIFSASSNPQPLQPAAQDRLSLFAQLAALLAGTPELRQSGQHISFQVVAAKSADNWTFQVDKQETVKLPIGAVSALKLSRVFKGAYDQTADVWLSPAYGYLPVKVRIAQSNGDVLEQNLSKVQVP